MEALRRKDLAGESAIAAFMDNRFYVRLHNKSDGQPVDFERIKDKRRQCLGIDVYLKSCDKDFYIDEKSTLHYINQGIKTFAFEINSLQGQDKHLSPGWLYNRNLKTTYYNLLYPTARAVMKDGEWVDKNFWEITEDDIYTIESIIIQRRKLISELANLGLSEEALFEHANYLRREFSGTGKQHAITLSFSEVPNMKIVYSGQLIEEPINLILSKDYLKSIASGVFGINRDTHWEMN